MKLRTVDVILAAFVVGALAALAAPGCSSESNTNATCTPNVTANGIRNVKNGCDTFAVCVVNGKREDPSVCCAGLTDGTLTDCLYGYGVGAPIGTGGGGASSTTTPGTGGSGGGGTAGGKGTSGGGGGGT